MLVIPHYKKIFTLILISTIALVSIGLHRKGRIEISNASIGSIRIKKSSTDNCDSNTRPIAVMISSDPEARPLSSISQADMIFEMPVTPNGITRMMAVFKCNQPQEIGSVRSARLDFIPLAQGLGAIYAHWGGEHTALTELDGGIIDNIDGLHYDGTIYFRKKTIAPPHNGFTSYALLSEAIKQRNYRMENKAAAYLYTDDNTSKGIQEPPPLYTGHMQVQWQYDLQQNAYLRRRDGKSEIDHNTAQQVSAKNIIVMQTTQSPMSKDYIRVTTVGSGKATIYQDGQASEGSWHKDSATDKLYFLDSQGKEIKLIRGATWVEIITS